MKFQNPFWKKSKSDPSEDSKAESFGKAPLGTYVLYEGEGEIVADVVFVHGLCGHALDTWSKGLVCWPRDFLKNDITKVRIITWGYDSSVANASKKLGAIAPTTTPYILIPTSIAPFSAGDTAKDIAICLSMKD
ncbi:hypothetical protein VF21_09395 [Pseudogymnoascus sp. 05NY08]|nr:hypothetical protein VF21_09395 [Pseudogymnoascus sp. 05NY08]